MRRVIVSLLNRSSSRRNNARVVCDSCAIIDHYQVHATCIAENTLPTPHSTSSFTSLTPPFLPTNAFAASYSTTTTAPPPPPPTPPLITEVSDQESFISVLQLSNTIPVILDAHAQWCAPCKQLDPELKKQVTALQGKIALAKLDIDNPTLAPLVQNLQISSVPTLFILFGGRVIDVKQGALSPTELSQWITKAIQLSESVAQAAGAKVTTNVPDDGMVEDPPTTVEQAFVTLRSTVPREEIQIETIAPKLAAVMNGNLNGNENNVEPSATLKAEAIAGLALCAVVDGDVATATGLLSDAKKIAEEALRAPSEGGVRAMQQVEAVEASLSLLEESKREGIGGGGGDGDGAMLQQQIASSGTKKDLEALRKIALALFGANRVEEAIDVALQIVKIDREWGDQAGKGLVVKMATAAGPDSEIGKSARRRLSNMWFI